MIQRALLMSLLVALTLNFLFARLELQRASYNLPSPTTQDRYTIPSAPITAGLFLNYRTFAADLLWVRSLIYYGEQQRKQRPHTHLDLYAYAIADADPDFYKVYSWFSSTYVMSRYPVTTEDLETANRFLDRGMARFPTDTELPYLAAMNYIGFSAERTTEDRLFEVNRALDYLHRGSQLRGAREDLPFVASWFYNRRRQLQAGQGHESQGLPPDAVDFYVQMYQLTTDETRRERFRQTLEAGGVDSEVVLAQARAYAEELRRHHQADLTYLHVDLWTAVNPTASSTTP